MLIQRKGRGSNNRFNISPEVIDKVQNVVQHVQKQLCDGMILSPTSTKPLFLTKGAAVELFIGQAYNNDEQGWKYLKPLIDEHPLLGADFTDAGKCGCTMKRHPSTDAGTIYRLYAKDGGDPKFDCSMQKPISELKSIVLGACTMFFEIPERFSTQFPTNQDFETLSRSHTLRNVEPLLGAAQKFLNAGINFMNHIGGVPDELASGDSCGWTQLKDILTSDADNETVGSFISCLRIRQQVLDCIKENDKNDSSARTTITNQITLAENIPNALKKTFAILLSITFTKGNSK